MNRLIIKDHIPVLLKEVIAFLKPQDDKIYVDATFGAGGYTSAILKSANCRVIAIDCDNNAAKYFAALPEDYRKRCQLVNKNFLCINEILADLKISSIDGIVFDLGLSSMQIADHSKGFSFHSTDALDMRMSGHGVLTAAYIVNKYTEKQIADILFYYGGEKKSRSIARNIVKYRQKQNIITVPQLLEAIIPSLKIYKDQIHFATRTFQALRIHVNNELETLYKTTEELPSLVKKEGSIIFVTFHSLEDKIVKEKFKKFCAEKTPLIFSNLTKKVVVPTSIEVKMNPRARSAKLRAIRKM